ncbi:MAG: rRNA maturation RNase YbeY [Oscillospiraceae bacterium]|nr:rRNA maturation RNase YbeY [Oscillospiraceae bacterium]
MIKIKLILSNRQKERLPEKINSLIRRSIKTTLIEEGFPYNAEVSLSFVDNKEIRELNRDFRDKDLETDVLSFPLGENGDYDENPENGYKLLGDIVISVEKAYEQADLFGHSKEREIAFLTVHSMLHLLGYDHVNSEEEELVMREKQAGILLKMGINRE